MRGRWALAALAAGVIAVAGCSDDPGETTTGTSESAAGEEQTCAAAEQAITEHGGSVQTALTGWDGSSETVGEISDAAGDWAQATREVAAGAEDAQLRTMLEDLATEIDEFGESWENPESEPDLSGVETALEPLDDRCQFGEAARLTADENTTDVCAAALEEAGSGSFDEVSEAADEANQALESGDQAALDDAVADLQVAAGGFAQSFRDIAEDAEDEELRTALTDIAAAVEEWAASFEDGEPQDLTGFQEAVLALGAVCE